VFIYSSRRKWVFSPLLWSCPPTATFTSFPAPGCWMCTTAPAFSSRLVVRDFSSPSLQHSGCSALFATCLFCCYCLLFSFSFLPGLGLVCPGWYAELAQGCLWEYLVPLSSPCSLRLPKRSWHWHLEAAWGPSWFLRLMCSGDGLRALGVWRTQSIASSRWFFL
jgi:hypothetical protein